MLLLILMLVKIAIAMGCDGDACYIIPPPSPPGIIWNTPRERNTHKFFMSLFVAEDAKGARIHSIIYVIHFHNTFWLKALNGDPTNSFQRDEVYLKVL